MCAVTRERTLPALEAAHIRPFSDGGEHEASNGVLLRRDIHSLFDSGYVTITPNLNFEVSRRVKEEFENAGIYELHGRAVAVPEDRAERSSPRGGDVAQPEGVSGIRAFGAWSANHESGLQELYFRPGGHVPHYAHPLGFARPQQF